VCQDCDLGRGDVQRHGWVEGGVIEQGMGVNACNGLATTHLAGRTL